MPCPQVLSRRRRSLGVALGSGGPATRVIACGGAGCNILREIPEELVKRSVPLDISPAPPLADGAVLRPAALGDAVRGGEIALGYSPDVRALSKHLVGADIIFVVAGLGGKTGTWVAPAICYAAASKGILTLPMVTMPMRVEGHHRHSAAMEALPLLMEHADLTATFAMDRLMGMIRHAPMGKAFQAMNRIVATALVALGGAFEQGDIAILKDYFGRRREGRLGIGQGQGRYAARDAVAEALESPWFSDLPPAKVDKGIAVLEGAAPESDLEDEVMSYLGRRLPSADILYSCSGPGTERLRVTLLLSL